MKRAVIGAVVVAIASFAENAQAEIVVGATPEVSLLVDAAGTETDVAPGFGGSLSLGYAPDLFPLLIVPELRIGAAKYTDTYERLMLDVAGGLSLGWSFGMEPQVFAHVGYGYADGEDGDALLTQSGLWFDAGARVDVRLSRWVTLGPELQYGALIEDRTAHVLTLGGRLALWF